MSNNKQSSVEWYIIERHIMEIQSRLGLISPIEYDAKLIKIEEQAKAMQKKQCVDFALKCMLNGLEPHQSTREVVEKLFDESLQ